MQPQLDETPPQNARPRPGDPYEITAEGSLALLAMGYQGIEAWRHKRDNLPGQYIFKKAKQFRPTRRIKHQTGKRLAQKVLVIGWDAADWKAINPIMDAGHMPTLERLVNSGAIGNLATLDPPLSPLLWTSVATGHTADKHGVLGFVQPNPDTQTLRPVLGTSRQRKAVWNILNQTGLRSHIVGWWPSHPAEPLNGVTVSNFYQKTNMPLGSKWQMAPNTVHPPRVADTLADLRVHPHELTAAHILPFVPNAADIDQSEANPLQGLTSIIAHCASIQAAATWAMTNEPWDFMAVYFDGLDHFKHQFMRFHPPQRPHIPQKFYDLYKYVVTAAYRFHDMMLHYMLQLAGPDTTVILLSDHGFHPDHLRPTSIPKEPAGPAIEHRNYGVVCVKGPHVQQDERFYGATLLDIAPTILHLFGLPIGQDMDGKPLVQALEKPTRPGYIPTWETVAGDTGQYDDNLQQDPWAEQAMMKQLIELGYIEADTGNKQFERLVMESDFYLARVYNSRGKRQEALQLFEKLYALDPTIDRYALSLARCYITLGRLTDCRRIIEEIDSREEKPKTALNLLQAHLLLAEGHPEESLSILQQLQEKHPAGTPQLHSRVGHAYRRMKAWPQAIEAYLKTLALDPENATVYCDLASVYLYLKQYEKVVDSALTAVGLLYHQPLAHYYLAEGLRHLGEWERATEAYQVCLSQAPGLVKAYQQLAELYELYWKQPDAANEYRARATELIANAQAYTEAKAHDDVLANSESQFIVN